MTNVSNSICAEKKYSYQHIQGMMLLSFNKIASTLKLTHSEYRVMCTLIGLYNKEYNKAFPTIDYLAKHCTMGKVTVIKGLNRLVELNLLVVAKTPGKRNNYYFSKLLLNKASSSPVEPQRSSVCKTTYKQIKIETNKNQSSSNNKNDDESIKTTNMSDYKEVISKLDIWGFTGAKKLLKQKSVETIKKFIELVENINPDNKGAYLRALINNHLEIKQLKISSDSEQIKQMLKHQYWKHLPTGKICKVKPDMGIHLLIRYHKNEKMVEFLESGLCDQLDNFESCMK